MESKRWQNIDLKFEPHIEHINNKNVSYAPHRPGSSRKFVETGRQEEQKANNMCCRNRGRYVFTVHHTNKHRNTLYTYPM